MTTLNEESGESFDSRSPEWDETNHVSEPKYTIGSLEFRVLKLKTQQYCWCGFYVNGARGMCVKSRPYDTLARAIRALRVFVFTMNQHSLKPAKSEESVVSEFVPKVDMSRNHLEPESLRLYCVCVNDELIAGYYGDYQSALSAKTDLETKYRLPVTINQRRIVYV